MPEQSNAKIGDTITYQIGGKAVKLVPAPLKKTKAAFNELITGADDVFDRLRNAAVILLSGDNDFATAAWIEENMSLPQVSQVIEDARKVNGLGADGFFQKGPETRELTEKKPTP